MINHPLLQSAQNLAAEYFRLLCGVRGIAANNPAASFRTNSRKFESSERLPRYHSAGDAAIDVQVSDFKIGCGSIDMRRRARIQSAG